MNFNNEMKLFFHQNKMLTLNISTFKIFKSILIEIFEHSETIRNILY